MRTLIALLCCLPFFAAASEYQIIATSPDPIAFVGSPNLVILPSGRYVASVDEWADGSQDWPRKASIYISDDAGETWDYRATLETFWGSLVLNGGEIYHVGVDESAGAVAVTGRGDLGLITIPIKEGLYSAAPTSYSVKDGRAYFAFENRYTDRPYYASMQVFSAKIGDNWLDPDSWSWSNEVDFPGVPQGLNWGLHTGKYRVAPIGWLEGNVVEVDGDLKVFARLRTGGVPNYAAVFSIVEGDTPGLNFDYFAPWPGGQNKFHIVYDETSQRYWMASNMASDHLQDKEALNETGFKGPPDNERRNLLLWSSVDSLNWFPATTVASSENMLDAFSYPYLVIDGDDLLVVSRTAVDAVNQHDTNMVTLHRIENFRSLAAP